MSINYEVSCLGFSMSYVFTAELQQTLKNISFFFFFFDFYATDMLETITKQNINIFN
jgi:hypothetical protein